MGVSAATESITKHIDGARAHQRIGDLERLLAGIGLRDQQLIDIDAELPGIARIERMLGIDERRDAAALLRFGDDVLGERGLARAFRPEDLDDAPARHAADAEREIEPQRARRDRRHSTAMASRAPSFMIEPLPKALSIWERAASSALFLSMGLSSETTLFAFATALSCVSRGEGRGAASGPVSRPLRVNQLEAKVHALFSFASYHISVCFNDSIRHMFSYCSTPNDLGSGAIYGRKERTESAPTNSVLIETRQVTAVVFTGSDSQTRVSWSIVTWHIK